MLPDRVLSLKCHIKALLIIMPQGSFMS